VRGTTKRVPLLPDVEFSTEFSDGKLEKPIIDKWWMVHVTNTNKKHRIQGGLSWIAGNILGFFLFIGA